MAPQSLRKIAAHRPFARRCRRHIFRAQKSWRPLGLRHRAANAASGKALVACARYLGKIAWPANLYIPYRFSETYDIATLSIAAIILVAISAAVLFLRRAKPYLFTGWFWFLGTLLPVLGLAQIGAYAMADRYTYIAAIGIFIGATWFCADLLARWRVPRTVIGWICALIISACVIKTSFQLPHWENTETLLNHTLQLDPKNYLALESLGDEFGRQKRTMTRWIASREF